MVLLLILIVIINTTMSNNQEGDDNDASQKVDNSQLSITQAFARVIPQCSNKKKRSKSLPSRNNAKKAKHVSLYVFKQMINNVYLNIYCLIYI